MADIKVIAETLANLTVKEVSEPRELLKEEYGTESVAAAVAVADPTAGAIAEAEEKNSFDVVLKSFGSVKLAVVKAVKEHAGLNSKEAKEPVDAAPVNTKEGFDKVAAEALKAALEEVGTEVELK